MTEPSQAARDLVWVVNSPSFVSGDNVAPPAQLALDEIDEAALGAFLAARPSHRVGHYFEALLHFWLEHIRNVEMLAAGKQIKDGKRTIGELDFVYRNGEGKVVHCEASVKFFLHHVRPDTSHFPGPNATDNYERKVDRLFDHQLALSERHWPDVDLRHAFVKGMVFWRGAAARPDERPQRMPADALSGRWLFHHELNSLRDSSSLAGIADKPHWLAPCPADAVKPIGELCDEMQTHFAGAGYPLMVSLRHPGTGRERERLFVVRDAWPD